MSELSHLQIWTPQLNFEFQLSQNDTLSRKGKKSLNSPGHHMQDIKSAIDCDEILASVH